MARQFSLEEVFQLEIFPSPLVLWMTTKVDFHLLYFSATMVTTIEGEMGETNTCKRVQHFPHTIQN